MAKYRLAGRAKKRDGRPAAAVPCVVLILSIFLVIMFLFYFLLRSGS